MPERPPAGKPIPLRASEGRARDPSALARELLDLPAEDLPGRLRAGLRDAPRVLEAMRTEASRFYSTDAEMARSIARRACVVADRIGDPVAVGWGRRALAESCLFSGRMREAEAAYAAAARTWREAGATALLGQLLVGRIHVLALLGRIHEVEAVAREARRHLQAAGDQGYLAKLAMNLGNLHFQREEYTEALSEYERAAGAFDRLRVRDQTVVGLEVNRAVALTQLDRDVDALRIFRRLDRECAKHGFDLLRAQVRMNGAYVHFLRADFDLALRDLAPAADYFRRTEHPAFLASCLLNRAEIYQQLNLHREAGDLAREAAALFQAEGLRDDRALALSQEVLSRLALDEPALPTLREARRLFHREKSLSRVAVLDLLEARARMQTGAPRRAGAAALAKRARDTFRKLRLIRWEAEATAVLVCLEENRLGAARCAQLLSGLLRRLPLRIYPLQACRLLEQLGARQEESGRTDTAARTFARAAAVLEGVRTHVPSEDSKISFLGDKTQLYDRILGLELQRARPRPDRLFEWMERSRAQSLWDRMREPSSTDNGLGESLTAERRRLSWLHARISRLELGSAEERARAAGLRAELRRAEQRWSRLLRARAETRVKTRGRFRGDEDEGTASDPSKVARRLPKGWGFLSYHLGSEFSLAVVITREGATWRRLASDLSSRVAQLADRLDFQWAAAAMQAARRSVLEAASPALSGTVSPASNRLLRMATDAILGELSKLLWAPLEEMGIPRDLNWIISPHGTVHRIPLVALRDDHGYLIERTNLSLAPSARIWSRLPGRASPASRRRAWIAGVPSPSLPGVDREVALVAERLREWTTETELRPTREGFQQAGRSSGLMHLAAHGSFRRDNPAFSFVELADGPLFAHDLAEMRLPGSVIVLTACSSGRGAAPAGDEWIGLARGFLQAGASSVVASLWPIPDEPTCDLVDRFYEGLSAGSEVPLAVGQAMREVIPVHPHPWAWSAFTVLGGSARGR